MIELIHIYQRLQQKARRLAIKFCTGSRTATPVVFNQLTSVDVAAYNRVNYIFSFDYHQTYGIKHEIIAFSMANKLVYLLNPLLSR
jgi:hypothetical protein